MFSRISKLVLSLVLISALVLPEFFSCAQEQENLQEICQIEKIEEQEKTLSRRSYEDLLKKCQIYYEEQSKQIEKDLSKTQKEKKTLQNQIYILNNKIKNLGYQIYQGNVMIKELNFQIEDTQGSIDKTGLKIENSRDKLEKILRLVYEEDQRSMVEILLKENDISEFFDNLIYLETLNSKNQELLKEIKSLKSYLEGQKQALDQEKGDLERVVKIQLLQKKESADVKRTQEHFLNMREKDYQKYLKEQKETERKAAEIRSRIFELIGVSEAPTFGEAYELAKYVESITKVRPALLLAILTQESNIGKNVGQCYLKDFNTGMGVKAYNGKKISRVMKPTRDIKPFLSITKELGRDPKKTLVSCPMKYGYGGAMGPAQFIPSTWILYRDKVKAITGKPADPWNIKDAFLASALYLADCGATKQTYNSEWRAAMIYFSGSTNKKYSFYGNSVMAIAEKLQKDIQTIE